MARKSKARKGFLTRLLRNEAGNTLALTAAATLPLLGMIGGGVDVSRLYLVKTRLQQACDAGALAGRKAQSGGVWTTAHQGTANQVFATNFETGAYGTSGLSRSFTENSGTVTGTASVTVPMMIMKVFGKTQEDISVACDAEMRLPNTDIMFVLDVTGSMGSPPSSGGYSSKLSGLKIAVQCFYEVVMKLDTPADCGSAPSGGISNDIQVRFGFVPYNVNVNVGKLLPNSYLADTWPYQSRISQFSGTYTDDYGNWQHVSGSRDDEYNGNASNCPVDTVVVIPGTPTVTTNPDVNGNLITTTLSTRTTNGKDYTCERKNNGKYKRWLSDYDNYVEQKTDVQTPNYTYTYQEKDHDVSALKAGGSSWNSSLLMPVGPANADVLVSWDGCIEERQTVRTTNFNPIPSGAKDLNIDMVPTSDWSTQWGPILPGAVWGRYTGSGNSYNPVTTSSDLNRNHSYYCPTEGRKLARYETITKQADFVAYVNTLTDNGNTYHDIGLLWGTRLMSPTGIFASENAFTPQGGEIERHLIFMTDGDACTGNENYTAYGVPWWDRRRTSISTAPSGGCTSSGTITEQVNLRTEALCTAIKNKNITLWVVNYGGGVSTSTGSRLQACASPGRYYEATSTTDLMTTFQAIAAQISQLRLTK